MAVQIPDPGTGNGQTGDNEYVFRKKVKDNFSDQTNAASRLIGIGDTKVPAGRDVFSSAFSSVDVSYTTAGQTVDFNDLPVGKRIFVISTATMLNAPIGYSNTSWVVETSSLFATTVGQGGNGGSQQIAYAYGKNIVLRRTTSRPVSEKSGWTEWQSIGIDPKTYSTTTASGANAVITADGSLQRSTSSERYKDILAPLVLDDARYADAMALKPIIYRSLAGADNPSYHFYSFSAEELGAYDPAFTLWRETETVTDKDGNISEQPLAERQAEGININALLAMSHAIAIKQDKIIKALEHRLDILEAK